ncbi:Isocitrate dehydrogenase [NAD] subunit mitochondrial [Fasciola gigantica]|uniref:Isocitrate dehydrogenase [NAD] subunit mitochondrial n=1 Tax=Fasciola gigantica TaxID=46835 RepID=A0A504YQB3_FASGI|nr:Isocitrate dehydrogenase [NAD] subunit mitochondrial [Fasciola gigantica]
MSFRCWVSSLINPLGRCGSLLFCNRSLSSASLAAQKKRVTLIPGDGVWPELFVSVKHVFRELGVPVDFDELHLSGLPGAQTIDLDIVLESLSRNKVGLKGILRTPVGTQELKTLNMRMRRILDLYANVVHIRSLPGLPNKHGALDFVIIREQLEGEYSALEHESVAGVVESLKIMTRYNCERIAKFAFDYAVRNRRHMLAVFEPGTRHSFAMASGRDIANPTAILLASTHMLRHMNLTDYAVPVESAVLQVIREGKVLTPDIGGCSTTTEFTDAVLKRLKPLAAR